MKTSKRITLNAAEMHEEVGRAQRAREQNDKRTEAEVTDRICRAMEGMVLKCVHKSGVGSSDWDEAIQEGYIAVYNSIFAWAPGRSVRFVSYATEAIKNNIRRKFFARNRFRKEEFLTSVSAIHDEEILEGIPEPECECDEASQTPISVPVFLGRLSPMSQKCIRLRFGFDGSPERTTKEVAAMIGRSQPQTRYHINSGIKRIRWFLLKSAPQTQRKLIDAYPAFERMLQGAHVSASKKQKEVCQG